jgi:cobalt-zinc-cadmium efflux system membrane fusion protein
MTTMKNKPTCETAPVERPLRFKFALACVLPVAATIVATTGCTPKTEDNAQAASVTASEVTLTPAQRKNVHLYTVVQSSFGNTVETSGTVDFDNDHATSVLAPFSGPVSRLLVSPGENVRKGDPLAVVDSPDFASAISAYGKATATATNARRLAAADKDLVAHDGVAAREAQQAETDASNADADRDAALQALRSLGVDPRTINGIHRHPCAHHWDGGGENDHARTAPAGGHYAVLYRRRPLEGLGQGADIRVRPCLRPCGGPRRRADRWGVQFDAWNRGEYFSAGGS